jgi:hypothetical protein
MVDSSARAAVQSSHSHSRSHDDPMPRRLLTSTRRVDRRLNNPRYVEQTCKMLISSSVLREPRSEEAGGRDAMLRVCTREHPDLAAAIREWTIAAGMLGSAAAAVYFGAVRDRLGQPVNRPDSIRPTASIGR